MNDQTPIERKGMAPVLRMAVLAGIKASVQLHLRLGGAVDAMDDKGRTPLILAASRGHVEICRLLLDAGADLTHIDKEGNDALLAATAKGHHGVAELLHAVAVSSSEPPPIPSQVVEVEAPDATGGAEVSHPASHMESEPASGLELQIESTVCEPQAEAAPDAVPDTETKAVADAGTEPPAVPADTADGAVHTTVSVSPPNHSQADPEGFDLSGWEEEADSPPPPSDPTCADRADELQKRLSLHVPVDMDEDWDDVDIELPDILISVRRRARLDGDEEATLKELVLSAVMDGRIRGDDLSLVAPRDQDALDHPDPDYIANLRVMLGDLGIIVDDDPTAPDHPSASGETDEEDDRFRDEAAEGLVFLRNLNSNRSDPLALYIGGLPRDRLTRDDEASLAMVIERGIKDALAAVAMSPAAVSELLCTFEAVIGGQLPPGKVVESDEEDDADEDVGTDEDGAQVVEADVDPIGRSLPQELLCRLEAICDLCRRLSQVHDVGFTERLGDRLAALGLSHTFVSRLRCTVKADPRGDEARRLMEAGMEKARKARERFALANLKLVVWGAKRFGGLTWSDRIQEGNRGLLKAVERFDHRRGAKFSTYATWWIKQSITRAVADTSRTVRVPVHAYESMRKVRWAQNQLFSLTGRDPTPEEIADLTELPLVGVKRLLAVAEEPVSLDTEEGWREAAAIASLEPDPEERLAIAEIKSIVRQQLELLHPREATIIRMRFGIGCDREHTLEEVGQQFDLTRERIRQIEAKALGKLSHPGRIKALQGCR